MSRARAAKSHVVNLYHIEGVRCGSHDIVTHHYSSSSPSIINVMQRFAPARCQEDIDIDNERCVKRILRVISIVSSLNN